MTEQGGRFTVRRPRVTLKIDGQLVSLKKEIVIIMRATTTNRESIKSPRDYWNYATRIAPFIRADRDGSYAERVMDVLPLAVGRLAFTLAYEVDFAKEARRRGLEFGAITYPLRDADKKHGVPAVAAMQLTAAALERPVEASFAEGQILLVNPGMSLTEANAQYAELAARMGHPGNEA